MWGKNNSSAERMTWSRLRTIRWNRCCLYNVLIIFLLLFTWTESFEKSLGFGLSGSSQKCDKEGEIFPLPGSLENKCFTCLCKEGRVECEKQSCPNLQGCYLIAPDQRDGCCGVCKGCKLNNMTFKSGTQIIRDCTTTTCSAGVITRSPVKCHVPCRTPSPPVLGQCCPSCRSCSLNGREFQPGEEATLPNDPCVRCKCESGGSMVCTKITCPVLSCPASSIFLQEGECCPRCNGSRSVYIPRTVCLLGEKAFPSGTSFRLDSCTNCTCLETTSICDRMTCPALECQPSHQVMTPGNCCPRCVEPAVQLPRMQCVFNSVLYKNEEKWNIDNCRGCICDGGKVRCAEQICEQNKRCPRGFKLAHLPNKCCSECVGEDGVCTVFGDPHYKSFDGRWFNFQGACKYMLTSDCRGKSFSIRVRNDARESRAFSWTRTVTLKVKEGRVILGQNMRIKFNGKRVALPFGQGSLLIYKEEDATRVETGIGVQLLWNGESFLEVTVPHSMRGRLCGLCGNFNGDVTDEFITRRGGPANLPSAFGQSWKVGGKKTCSRSEEVKVPEPYCQKNWRTRNKAEKMCRAIKSPVFFQCHRKVPFERYFKSCTLDMCECPQGRKCHCEVLTAYARACERSGVATSGWRNATGCLNLLPHKW